MHCKLDVTVITTFKKSLNFNNLNWPNKFSLFFCDDLESAMVNTQTRAPFLSRGLVTCWKTYILNSTIISCAWIYSPVAHVRHRTRHTVRKTYRKIFCNVIFHYHQCKFPLLVLESMFHSLWRKFPVSKGNFRSATEISGQQRNFPLSNGIFRSATEFSAMGNVF